MTVDSNTRLLFFAPHPDDEALAAGGLLQKAVAAGARVDVVFATNGDDNPWPHRVVERRWKIEIEDRMLWGMRRAQEALDAVTTLGIDPAAVEFLHLPDQRITELFLNESGELLARLVEIIEQVQPTLVLAPSLFDLHPDHSALHLFVRLALARSSRSEAELLCYSVHTRGYQSDWSRSAIELTPQEQEIKRRAILCHRTQMVLSRKRFLRYVTATEEFWRPAPPHQIDGHHPVRCARLLNDVLLLQVQRRKRSRSFAKCTLLVATEHGDRWQVQLRRRGGSLPVCDTETGATIAIAQVEIHGVSAQIRLPLRSMNQPVCVFAKLKEATTFYDVGGWREVPPVVTEVAPDPLRLPRARRRSRVPRIRAKAAR